MALKLKEGITITRLELDRFYIGFEHFFPPQGIYINSPIDKWKNREDFAKNVQFKIGVDISKATLQDIKKLEEDLETIVVNGEAVQANLPQKNTRELQEAERAKKGKGNKRNRNTGRGRNKKSYCPKTKTKYRSSSG